MERCLPADRANVRNNTIFWAGTRADFAIHNRKEILDTNLMGNEEHRIRTLVPPCPNARSR
jgi:hypothetical protein